MKASSRPGLQVLRARMAFFYLTLLQLCLPLQAQTLNLNASLGERIEFVRKSGAVAVDLQVTVFQPEGPGPFPVVVINHGKDSGDIRLQARNRPIAAAREFLERGYVVVVPMLQGFAGSGGSLVEHGCNTQANGEAQMEDLAAVVRWLRLQRWADTSRMMMTGQSYGGLATMAYSQNPDPGFKLFVNFAGGVKYVIGCDWQARLRDAFQSYGKKSKTPSIWFYGENDSYFPPRIITPAFQAFAASGGNGEMVAYGSFGADAHSMFANVDGADIWLDRLLLKMKTQGLPVDIVFPRYGRIDGAPLATAYAQVADFLALERLNVEVEKAYGIFLKKRLPRAFVIAPKTGRANYAWGGDNPLVYALEACEKASGEACILYAVDDAAPWKRNKALTVAGDSSDAALPCDAVDDPQRLRCTFTQEAHP